MKKLAIIAALAVVALGASAAVQADYDANVSVHGNMTTVECAPVAAYDIPTVNQVLNANVGASPNYALTPVEGTVPIGAGPRYEFYWNF